MEAQTNIIFQPLEQSPDFIQAAQEYKDIWQNDGEKIIKSVEKISGLHFKENSIEAMVYEGISVSNPLKLRASNSREAKKGTLVHELCHILLDSNNIESTDEITPHRLLDLILYDIWIDIYGKEFADNQVMIESSRTNASAPYKECWEWALAKTPEERKKLFEEVKIKYLNKDNGKQV